MRYSILVHAENGIHNINGWGQSKDKPATKSGKIKKILGLISKIYIYIYVIYI